MRSQVLQALRRIGLRAGYDPCVLNNKVMMKWNKDMRTIYAFQISDGIGQVLFRDLYETDAEKRFYLVDGQDRPFMMKRVREIATEYSDVVEKITFVSLKEIRNSLEVGLEKETIGTAVYSLVPDPNVRFSGSMPDVHVRTGLILARLGKAMEYPVRNSEEGHYVWLTKDYKGTVLEVVIGNGFSFRNVRMLAQSDAQKKMYIATRLYGSIYEEAVNRIIALFPAALIEYLSVAEVGTMKELETLLFKRISQDLKISAQIESAFLAGQS